MKVSSILIACNWQSKLNINNLMTVLWSSVNTYKKQTHRLCRNNCELLNTTKHFRLAHRRMACVAVNTITSGNKHTCVCICVQLCVTNNYLVNHTYRPTVTVQLLLHDMSMLHAPRQRHV